MRLFNIKNFLISGAMASLLMSCAVGKKYTRTDLQIPEKYKESLQVTGDTVVLPWKTFSKILN
ncbi:hypothetical protein OWR28_22780 [Chryseobacterium sp. 1B4]